MYLKKKLLVIYNNFTNFVVKFIHQFRLLIWKNFLIKKRSPFVFLFELIVPLVLFLIMVGIRKKQDAKPVDIQNFDAWPLPSAGFVPVMQGFCNKKYGIKNEYGYYEYPNATVKDMLKQIDKLNDKNLFNLTALHKNFDFLNNLIDQQNNVAKRNRRSINDYINSNNEKKENEIIYDNLYYLQTSIKEISKLSAYFPRNLCNKLNKTTNSTTNNDKIKERTNIFNSKTDSNLRLQLMKNSGFIGLWLNMQKTFCGASTSTNSLSSQHTNPNPTTTNNQTSGNTQPTSSDADELDLTPDQFKSISLIFHLLYSNPIILYSPNSTLVANLIKKTNQTFELLDQITQFSRLWLNESVKIADYLRSNQTSDEFNLLNSAKNSLSMDKSTDLNQQELIDNIEIINSAACSWLSLMSGVNLNVFKGFKNEDDLVSYFLNDAYNDNITVIASIVFSNINENTTVLPKYVEYKIRQNASFTQSTKRIRDRYWFPSARSYNYFYYIFGFVWLQDLIDRSIIDSHSNTTVLEPGSYVHQMPYPCYLSDDFLTMIEHVMPLCLAISFVYTVSMIGQTIVYEKEQRLKEVMKIMGLYNSVHWFAWFITYFIQLTFIMVIITLILHFGKILMHSDPVLIFLLLEIYAISTICFSFLVSVLYSKAKLAAACAGIMYFLSYVPCMYITIREEVAVEVISTWIKLCASMLSTSAFGIASKYIAFYENGGTGLHWSNIDKSPLEDDKYNCLLSVKCMIFDCFLYIMLTWYIENVHPGYGIPRPWYFIFQYSYWFDSNTAYQHVIEDTTGASPKKTSKLRQLFGCCLRSTEELSYTEAEQARFLSQRPSNSRRHLFELEPLNLNIGVQVKNLTKIYSNKKVAVNNLTINFYENQITSFLGHNGAGKSTTMSMLTGLMPATAGHAYIYGRDIRTNINKIRSSMGWCPQHNILFEKLTVEEHLWFYAKLKHINDASIKYLIENMLKDTGLRKKRNNLVNTLSGGMQRKLSVAIAFVGDANVVLLDEPTAGVDPYARRAIWDLLLKYKQGRTIILSTHHMDEAELLGDRIAIISNGVLQCCGTSLFLKNVLGEGNHLTLVKRADNYTGKNASNNDYDDELIDIAETEQKKDQFASSASMQSTGKLINFIQTYIPSAYLKAETLREYHFVIPLHERCNTKYWDLFETLEKHFDDLNISSYGIQDISLEEVFLKAAQLDDKMKQNEKMNKNNRSANNFADNDLASNDEEKIIGNADSDRNSCWNSLKKRFKKTESVTPKTDHTPQSDTETTDDRIENLDYIYKDLESGWRLMFKQFFALTVKRYLYNKRNWKSLITQIVLPACFICVAMTVALSAPGFPDLPPLDLSPSQFYPLTQPQGTFVPFSYRANGKQDPKDHSASSPQIIETLRFIVGMASTCTLNQENVTFNDLFDSKQKCLNSKYFGNDTCKMIFDPNSDIDLSYLLVKETFINDSHHGPFEPFKKPYYPTCKCKSDNSGFECSDESTFDYPPSYKTVTHETIYNISGLNESNYLLYTTDLYRLQRYGGISLDNEKEMAKNEEFYFDTEKYSTKFITRRLSSVWYNHKAFHAMPTYVNVMNNAILRANVRKTYEKKDKVMNALIRSNEYGIKTINHPMNHTNNYLSTEYILQGSDVIISIFTIVAMSFVPASFVLFLVYERSTKSLHLQFLIGLNPFLYWFTNFLWDLFNYLLPASCVIIILKVFDVPAYVEGQNFPAVISLFLLYGWSISPLMYPSSFLFNEPSNAYIFLIVINLFTGITCVVSSFLFQVFAMDSADLNFVYQLIKNIFLIFPPYCLGRGLLDIAYNDYYNLFYSKTGQIDKMRSPFAWDITTRNLISMAIIGAVSWIFTLLLEYGFFNRKTYKKCCVKPKIENETDEEEDVNQDLLDSFAVKNEDIDVAAERTRVKMNMANKFFPDKLIVNGLRKIYKTRNNKFSLMGILKSIFKRHNKSVNHVDKSKELVAVQNLCFGVPRGECFGLLGVNGAGKTTTFKMLTTDLDPTLGQISIVENNSSKRLLNSMYNKRSYWKYIGYCPQFDALYDELTPADHIRLFARLKGVKKQDENKLVTYLLRLLDLVEYTDKPVGSLSLGNRRKLSTALALVPNPAIVMLDEPTSGMDPKARRALWEVILDLTRNKSQSVLLTSHSMEECEVLCTRIAIMVDGKFKCLGSVQHLKSRFGDGYTLTVKVRETQRQQEDQHLLCHYESILSVSSASSQSTSIESSLQTDDNNDDECFRSDNRYINLIHDELKKFICEKCKLKKRHFNNVYQFELPSGRTSDEKINLGNIYRLIELNKLRFNIIDYSLTQNTLDNVFINFIKEHTDKRTKRNQTMDNSDDDDDDDNGETGESTKETLDKDDDLIISSNDNTRMQFPIHDADELILPDNNEELISSSLISTRTNSFNKKRTNSNVSFED